MPRQQLADRLAEEGVDRSAESVGRDWVVARVTVFEAEAGGPFGGEADPGQLPAQVDEDEGEGVRLGTS